MGVLPYSQLPDTREQYDTLLRAKGFTQYAAGYTSVAQIEPLYALEKEGGFQRGDPRGIAFATSRLAVGAATLRDMIVDAWRASAEAEVGYPMVNVRDIESGKVR